VYASNQIESLAHCLNKKAYTTSFYHGGNNGTMSFDAFAKLAGFTHYKGRNEYNNDADFDGKWGIFDEPFFKYVANDFSKTKEPFLGVVFSLSSHHPYTIPPHLHGKFRKGKLPIQEAIMYADYSLKTFFKKASQTTWFANTLFVITADHTSEAYEPAFNTSIGQYAIPILFYMPNTFAPQQSTLVAQQTDIMPTILHTLNYDKPFVTFGKVLTDAKAKSCAINYLTGTYQYITDSLAYHFDGEKMLACYRYKIDKSLKENILLQNPSRAMQDELFLKAFIQSFNKRMIHNQLSLQK
jgi:phosphoglycerol transferase MdoB-like AlkP superfamily enzyme